MTHLTKWEFDSDKYDAIFFFFVFLGAVTSSTASNAPASAVTASQAVAEQRNEQRPQENEWHEFTIPPLWKRIVAEIIDFFILFVLKLVVTYIAVDWFSLIDVDRYLFIYYFQACWPLGPKKMSNPNILPNMKCKNLKNPYKKEHFFLHQAINFVLVANHSRIVGYHFSSQLTAP